jgi:two-component sensor histidine kinase/CheY-like chemotaxis protein
LTYKALATATTQAIHWIGNKALPITTTIDRMHNELSADTIDVESLREDLELIDESARLIVEVKERLLGPAREQQPRPALLADVVRAAAFHTGVPDNQLSINVAPDVPLVLADTTQLARALGNLFQNALEANAKQITATITPAVEEWYVSLSIADDGDGIPPDTIDKIWASFVTTKGPSHSGMGLTACLHVITQLDGRITVESQPGEGTTFTILLPSGPEPAGANLDAAPANILLIDDDDEWAGFVASALTSAGKNVTRHTTVSAGEANNADLVLVDETLLVTPIAEILTALKDAGATEKTIVVAAAMRVERATSYLKAGVKDVVLKPYALDELAQLLV